MRYNIFYMIHKALRTLMYETAVEMQRTDFINQDEADAILKKISGVVDLFDKHAHHEDSQVFSALIPYEPSVVDVFEQEHVIDHELAEKLRTLINIYVSLSTDEEKTQLGSAIRRSFTDFMVFNLQHMAKEEEIINNLLWRHYKDEDIRTIERRIVESQAPEEGAFVAGWMMKSLSTREIVGWLKEVEKNAPEFVFNNLFETAERELPHARFQQVVEGLTEGVMLA
jgi:hypothetical protein